MFFLNVFLRLIRLFLRCFYGNDNNKNVLDMKSYPISIVKLNRRKI